jgi:glycosidase
MLDFVPNHTALDAEECRLYPEMYLQGDPDEQSSFLKTGVAFAAGRWMSPMHFAAQLNLFNERARRFQINNLSSIAKRCDGVRIHVAYYWITDLFISIWGKHLQQFTPPETEFWIEAVAAARNANPKFVLLGETYGEDVQRKLLDFGFDYVYDKDTYDCLTQGDVNGFRRAIGRFSNDILEKLLHFTENHDEVRAVTAFGGTPKMANAATAALLSLPGLRLVNYPQWLGYRYRIDVHLRRSADEDPDQSVVEFYAKFMSIINLDVLEKGTWEQLNVGGDVLAWTWSKDAEVILIVINFSAKGIQTRVDWPGIQDGQVEIRELISGTQSLKNAAELKSTGFMIDSDPWQVQVFQL